MTKEEFEALLAIEGKILKITPLKEKSLYYIALIVAEKEMDAIAYNIGKTPSQACNNLIKEYYADN